MSPDTLALIEASLPDQSGGILYMAVYRNRAGRLEYRARFVRGKETLGAAGTRLSAREAISLAILSAQRRLDDPALMARHLSRQRKRRERKRRLQAGEVPA